VLQVPGPGSGFGQVLLYTAEDGTQTWHLPEDVPAQGEAVAARGAERRTYRVPRMISPVPTDDPGTRGLIAAIGKKLLKVLAFRLIEEAGEFVAERIAARWEARNRPHRLRSFTPQDFSTSGRELGPDDWAHLASGPALLFVHGTFSRTDAGFGRLPTELVTQLHERYQGRVFAFDHPTLATSPTDNARWLAGQLPAGLSFQVDVVAHSRGGLVARELGEHGPELGLDRFALRRLVMVGTPNAGTALADVANWTGYLNRMTNLLQFVPDNPVTDTMDAVLTLLKHVALGAVRGLDGLTAMDPKGDYLVGRLNQPAGRATSGEYLAVASDYQPPAGSPLLRVARNGVTDLVFGADGNDLVVPTDGVFTVPGAIGFPIATVLNLPPVAAVDHTSYMANQSFGASLLEWLAVQSV